MRQSDFEAALKALGSRCSPGTEIYLAGGAALVMRGEIVRVTDDGDVIDVKAGARTLPRSIEEVGEDLALGPDWLNMNATAFREVLPSGHRQRADRREVFGNLTVHVLGRRDLMLLKAYAHRPGDLRDLEAMKPTGEDIDWLLGHLEGAARLNPHKVAKMEATLHALDPRSRKGRTR